MVGARARAHFGDMVATAAPPAAPRRHWSFHAIVARPACTILPLLFCVAAGGGRGASGAAAGGRGTPPAVVAAAAPGECGSSPA